MSTTFAYPTLPVARRELRAVAQRVRGVRCWTIKDPVTLRYFQLREEEHFILQLLDGRHSLDDIILKFERRFAPRRLKRSELTSFVMMLHREGLAVADSFGQAEHLLARRGEQRRRRWLHSALSILAWKLPGVNPDRWLTAVVQSCGWLFMPLVLAGCLMTLLAAVVLLASDFTAALARLPKFHELTGPGNWLSIALALALVKSLHELGHAITCKRFGGECNRLGVMLLLFTPALYCDVSDAWMFPQRWRRIAVSAAGIAVEVALASLAVILWSVTQPGWLNTLLFNIVLVCSVGTLLINGNPLLRYDGYFIFADWIGVPNLREQASAAVRRVGARWFAGVTLEEPRLLAESRPWLLLGYGLLSWAYRWLILLGILWLLHAALKPHGMGVLAQLAAVLVLASQAIEPATRGARYLSDPAERSKLRPKRLFATGALLTGLLAALLAIPLPRRVTAPLILQPADARQVFVTTPGVLEEALPPGTNVAAGATVARLRNRRLELELAELAARADEQRVALHQLQLRRHAEPALGDGLPAAEMNLADLEAQLAQKRRQQSDLVVKSPVAGTVLPPRSKAAPARSNELRDYSGTPLDPMNRGCHLEAGTLVAAIGSPAALEALVIVHESDVPLVAAGQQAHLAIKAAPGSVLTGEVAAIAQLNASDLPPELLATGAFPIERDTTGKMRPQSNYYQAIVRLDAHAAPLPIGGIGYGKIIVAREALGLRLYRQLRGTFRWPF